MRKALSVLTIYLLVADDCVAVSPPYYNQRNAAWADDQLGLDKRDASGDRYVQSGRPVSGYGCTISSVASLLYYYGIKADPRIVNYALSDIYQPRSEAGYAYSGDLRWWHIPYRYELIKWFEGSRVLLGGSQRMGDVTLVNDLLSDGILPLVERPAPSPYYTHWVLVYNRWMGDDSRIKYSVIDPLFQDRDVLDQGDEITKVAFYYPNRRSWTFDLEGSAYGLLVPPEILEEDVVDGGVWRVRTKNGAPQQIWSYALSRSSYRLFDTQDVEGTEQREDRLEVRFEDYEAIVIKLKSRCDDIDAGYWLLGEGETETGRLPFPLPEDGTESWNDGQWHQFVLPIPDDRVGNIGRFRIDIAQAGSTVPSAFDFEVDHIYLIRHNPYRDDPQRSVQIADIGGGTPMGDDGYIEPEGLGVTFPFEAVVRNLVQGQDSVVVSLDPTATGGRDSFYWLCSEEGEVIANEVAGRSPTFWHWFDVGSHVVQCSVRIEPEEQGFGLLYVTVNAPPARSDWGVPPDVQVNTIAYDARYIYIGGQGNDLGPPREDVGYVARISRNDPAVREEWSTGYSFNEILAGTPWGLLAATWRGVRLSVDSGETWEPIFRSDEPVHSVDYGSPCCDPAQTPRLLVGAGNQGYYGPWRVGTLFSHTNMLGLALGPGNVTKLRRDNVEDIALGSSSASITYRRFCQGNSSPPCASLNTGLAGGIDVYDLFELGGGMLLAAVKTGGDAGNEFARSVWRSDDYGQTWEESSEGLAGGDDVVGFFRRPGSGAVLSYTRLGRLYESDDEGTWWAYAEAASSALPELQVERGQFVTTGALVGQEILLGTTKGLLVATADALHADEEVSIAVLSTEPIADGDSLRIVFEASGPGTLSISVGAPGLEQTTAVRSAGRDTVTVGRPRGMGRLPILTDVTGAFRSSSSAWESPSVRPRRPTLHRAAVDALDALQLVAGRHQSVRLSVTSPDAPTNLLRVDMKAPDYVEVDSSAFQSNGTLDFILAPDARHVQGAEP